VTSAAMHKMSLTSSLRCCGVL